MNSIVFNGGLQNGGISINGDFLGSLLKMEQDVPKATEKALKAGGAILKQGVKSEFVSRMPAAGRPFKGGTSKGGYRLNAGELLVDAVRQTKSSPTTVSVYVGKGGANSPLFISQMYNTLSNERYTKTHKGKKLKKKKYVGRIGGLNYFDTGLSSKEQEAYNRMEEILSNLLVQKYESNN